jgi:hypothetical protein
MLPRVVEGLFNRQLGHARQSYAVFIRRDRVKQQSRKKRLPNRKSFEAAVRLGLAELNVFPEKVDQHWRID